MMIPQTIYFHNENSLGNCWQCVMVLSCANKPGKHQKNACGVSASFPLATERNCNWFVPAVSCGDKPRRGKEKFILLSKWHFSEVMSHFLQCGQLWKNYFFKKHHYPNIYGGKRKEVSEHSLQFYLRNLNTLLLYLLLFKSIWVWTVNSLVLQFQLILTLCIENECYIFITHRYIRS